MKNNQKILIGTASIVILLISGCIEETQPYKNLEFEYEKYNNCFEIEDTYLQYLKEGNLDERIKKVFKQHNYSLYSNAKISLDAQTDCWRIHDNRKSYVICEVTKDVCEYIGEGYIKDINWDNNTLIIEVILAAICDDPNVKLVGDYKIGSDNISLTVSEVRSFFSITHSQCMGYYSVKFKIEKLEKKNYRILLYKYNEQEKVLIDEKPSTSN